MRVNQMEGGDAKTTCVKAGEDAIVQDGAQENKRQRKQVGPQMTKKFLKEHCEQNKLYFTPWLNDTLYLHFKGFSAIENLERLDNIRQIVEFVHRWRCPISPKWVRPISGFSNNFSPCTASSFAPQFTPVALAGL